MKRNGDAWTRASSRSAEPKEERKAQKRSYIVTPQPWYGTW